MTPRSARITLSFGRDSDGPRSVGYFNMLGLSFALYQIWLYMSVFSAAKTFENETGILSFAPLPIANHGILVYVFLLVSAALLMIFAWQHKAMVPFFESRRSVVVAGACGIVGTLLLQLGVGASAIGVIIAAFCMGVCASLFVVLLGSAFAEYEFITCILNTAVSVALGFICAVAFANWIPSPASGLLAILMPALMTIVFWKKTPSIPESTDSAIGTSYMSSYLAKFGVSMMLFGFVIGALRVICADRLLSSGAITIELVLGAACIVSVVAFVFAIVMSKRETLWDSLYRTLIPVVTLGLGCMVLLPSDYELIAAFFVTLGFVSLVTVVWVSLASLANNLNGSSIVIFGMGYGLLQAASALGCLVANGLLVIDGMGLLGLFDAGSIGDIPPIGSLAAAFCLALLGLVSCVVLAFGYALFPRYRELKIILSSVLSDMMLRRARQREDASDEAMTASGINQSEPESVSTAPMPAEGTMAAENAPSTSEQSSADAEADEAPREEKGSFVRRCEQLSREYNLSARESEVFFLLAKGHNAAFITDKLCVSRSTVKTHINHIYKKMDIHTQQELLNMVEDRARGPLGADIDRDAIREALERDPSQVVEHIHRDYIGF